MNLDALFRTFPEAPWLPYVVALVVTLTFLPAAINLYLTLADRRSDARLLERAEKATAILDKLPEGHKARSEMLTYISYGPIADLSLRHTTRAKRKKEAKKRRRENLSSVFSLVIPAVLVALVAPTFYNDVLNSPPPSLDNDNEAAIIVFATYILLLVYGMISISLMVTSLLAFKLKDLVNAKKERIWLWNVGKWQAWRGKGGVYQI